MPRLSRAAYETIASDLRVISSDEHGPKVLLGSDGRAIKLFRLKRLVSSTLVYPYARRFQRAARELADRDVPTITVERVARVPHLKRHAVIYRALEGDDLRAVLERSDRARRVELMASLARFMAQLHARGVYFRGMHFGNVVITPDGSFGLIDVSECRFRRGPLPSDLRARNFKPMLRYDVDRAALEELGLPHFVEHYLDATDLDDDGRRSLRARIERVLATRASE